MAPDLGAPERYAIPGAHGSNSPPMFPARSTRSRRWGKAHKMRVGYHNNTMDFKANFESFKKLRG